MTGRASWLAAVAVAAASCNHDVNLTAPRADGGGGSGTAGTSSTGGRGGGSAGTGGTTGTGGSAGTSGTPACSGSGTPIVLPTTTGAPCAAALVTRGHRFVLCSCGDMSASAQIRSDAFDSRNPTVTDESAAAYGINGNLNAIGEIRAGGAIYVAGSAGVTASSQFRTTSGSLRVAGPMTMLSSDNADIGGDAYINGNVTGNVRVSGTLHVPAGAALTGGVEYGTLAPNETVSVPPPCDCSAGFVDVASAIAAAAANNADATIPIVPTELAAATAARIINLYCGTYYLTAVDAMAGVTLVVHGRVLLAVAGDFTVRYGFSVQLDPSAELDLLIGGGLTTRNGGTFGATTAPARFRVWIAGTSSVVFDNAPWIGAVVHAPAAAVTASAGLPLSGSILARSISIGADSTLHYDRAILAAGSICGEPAAAVVP